MSINDSGNMDLRGTILCDNSVVIAGTDAAGNVSAATDSLRVTGYGIMGSRTGNIYITNSNTAATASIVFGVNAIHNGNSVLLLNKDNATFNINVLASNHTIKAAGTSANTVTSEYNSTHYARFEANSSGGVVKGIGGGGFLVRSYGDTYFNGGNFGIGIVTPARGDYGSITPKLHVLGSSGNGEYRLAARFQAGADADNTGAAVLINHSNDRGLLIEAGRESSDRGIAHFGIVNSSGTNVRILSLKQHSGTDYRFGVNAPSPKVDFDFQKYNSTNGSSSTMRIGGNSGNESSKLELAETNNGSGVMMYGYALVNDGSANKFRITSHNNSAGGNNSFEIDRVTGNVGIKGVSGAEALQVNGNIYLTNNSYIAFNTSASSGHPKIVMDSAGTFMFRNTANLTGLQIDNGGNIELNNGVNESVLVKGGTMNFGVPGNGSNVNGRFCTIEGNTDSSGEGSGRIFFAEHNSTTGSKNNYGMSLGYRGGGTTLPSGFAGLTQIGNGEWGMWGHNASQNGTLVMYGPRTAEWMRVAGRLGVGVTPNSSYRLDVNGTIRASADVIAYSDRRVKENIITVNNALDKVTKLRGVTYTRKDIEDKSTKLGVIAQEVLEVLPEVVFKDDEGKYSVAYGNMAGVFIEAIKELENRIKELENKSYNCKCK